MADGFCSMGSGDLHAGRWCSCWRRCASGKPDDHRYAREREAIAAAERQRHELSIAEDNKAKELLFIATELVFFSKNLPRGVRWSLLIMAKWIRRASLWLLKRHLI